MRKERNQKSFLALTGIIIIAISTVVGLNVLMPEDEQDEQEIPGVSIKIPEDEQVDRNSIEVEEPKEYVPVVFIGKNKNGEEVYKIVKREYDRNVDGTKLRFAITSLIMGPVQKEKANGIYSEVPTVTRILRVYEKSGEIIIDLSSGFVNGGGTDSVYKRLYQLIKTVSRNTDKPAYLYIDGKQADVIGGDGIMITQPLNENSIGE